MCVREKRDPEKPAQQVDLGIPVAGQRAQVNGAALKGHLDEGCVEADALVPF